jgi:hypothetical protein
VGRACRRYHVALWASRMVARRAPATHPSSVALTRVGAVCTRIFTPVPETGQAAIYSPVRPATGPARSKQEPMTVRKYAVHRPPRQTQLQKNPMPNSALGRHRLFFPLPFAKAHATHVQCDWLPRRRLRFFFASTNKLNPSTLKAQQRSGAPVGFIVMLTSVSAQQGSDAPVGFIVMLTSVSAQQVNESPDAKTVTHAYMERSTHTRIICNEEREHPCHSAEYTPGTTTVMRAAHMKNTDVAPLWHAAGDNLISDLFNKHTVSLEYQQAHGSNGTNRQP